VTFGSGTIFMALDMLLGLTDLEGDRPDAEVTEKLIALTAQDDNGPLTADDAAEVVKFARALGEMSFRAPISVGP
jgi:hypothetical protein